MLSRRGRVLLAARGVGGRWGAGLRLRSGAFAPDFPFVIFVQAFGLPFRFPRAHLHLSLIHILTAIYLALSFLIMGGGALLQRRYRPLGGH